MSSLLAGTFMPNKKGDLSPTLRELKGLKAVPSYQTLSLALIINHVCPNSISISISEAPKEKQSVPEKGVGKERRTVFFKKRKC